MNIKKLNEELTRLNEAEITFKDRCDWIREDATNAIIAIENVVAGFESAGVNWSKEKQELVCERLQEILQDCDSNCSGIAFRIKQGLD